MERTLVGAYDLANILGVHFTTIYRYVEAGMPYVIVEQGVASVKRFDVEECREWIIERRVEHLS